MEISIQVQQNHGYLRFSLSSMALWQLGRMNCEIVVTDDPNIGVDNPLFKRKVKISRKFSDNYIPVYFFNNSNNMIFPRKFQPVVGYLESPPDLAEMQRTS